MIDKAAALSALVLLIGFMAILVGFVPNPDLIIVVVIAAAMACADFYRDLFRKRGGNGNGQS